MREKLRMSATALSLRLPFKAPISFERRGLIHFRALLRALPLGLVLAASSAFGEQDNTAPSPDLNSTGVVPVSNDTFFSSLGVNPDASQGYNPYPFVLPLRYLGVRNIRDSRGNPSGLIMLHQQT